MFLAINDGSCFADIQAVVDADITGYSEGIPSEKKIPAGTSVRIEGVVVESPGENQAVEIAATKEGGSSIKILGSSEVATYPMAKGKHSREFLREIAHLRPRSNLIGAVARVRSSLAYATHEFFRRRQFLYVHTPLITASDCEGAGEMFQVTTMMENYLKKPGEDGYLPWPASPDKIDYSKDFFKKKSFLTVSGQLAVENYCCALSNVYTFGPTFRADYSNTGRHLAEFWMIEPELAFADLHDVMQCAEDYLKFCVQYAFDNNYKDLEFFDKMIEPGLLKRLQNLLESPFGRISYTEAIELLEMEVKIKTSRST